MMKNVSSLIMILLVFLLIGCREELDYVHDKSSGQNSYKFTKDNITTKKLFKQDYENIDFLKEGVDHFNTFLKQSNQTPKSSSSKSNEIEGIEVYTDVFEEVDYLNAKYYSFYILGTTPDGYEQKLVLKYINNQISEKHIFKYKRLPNLQIDPTSYQLEKLVSNTTNGSESSKYMIIEYFSVGCTSYMVTSFNCGHAGNHSNGQFCDVEQINMPQTIISSSSNCQSGGGGGSSPGDGSSSGGGGGPGDSTTPSVITIPTEAPIYSIKGIKTGTVKNPPSFNPLGLNTAEITQINSNDQLRLKIYQYLAIKRLYPFEVYLSQEQQAFVKAAIKYTQDNPGNSITDINYDTLNLVYQLLQDEYHDINQPLEIFNRIKNLEDALTQNSNLLLDIPCNQLPFWQDVATHQVPQSVKTKMQNIKNQTNYYDNWTLTDLDNGLGTKLNMDLFPVKITSLPNKPGTNVKYTPAEFFDFFRKNINLFAEKFIPIVDDYYGINDTALWFSNNPLGALIHIDITPDDGTVVCSGYWTNSWMFTTVKAPKSLSYDGIHPVAGNRLFSYYIDPNDNTMYIYTRGVDRVSYNYSDNSTIFNSIMQSLAFLGADNLWKGMQDKLSTFIINNGGYADKVTPEIYRPNYNKINNYIKGKAPLSSLGCN